MKVALRWLSRNWAPAICFALSAYVLISSLITADIGARRRGILFAVFVLALGFGVMAIQALWRWTYARMRSKAGGRNLSSEQLPPTTVPRPKRKATWSNVVVTFQIAAILALINFHAPWWAWIPLILSYPLYMFVGVIFVARQGAIERALARRRAAAEAATRSCSGRVNGIPPARRGVGGRLAAN